MDSPIVLILVTGLSSAATAMLMAYLGRRRERASTRKTTAEAKRTEQETEQSATAYWRDQVKELTKEMRLLKVDFKEFKEATEKEREQYQRQAVTLFDKIDTMSIDLARANKTIDELRETITELREQITELLVALAKKKE